MTILINGLDLSEIIETITWSGDDTQVSRKLEFSIAQSSQDANFPTISINEGDQVLLQKEDKTVLFGGIIFDIDRTASSNLIKYLAYDLMYYINQSEITRDYNAAPEEIAAQVCTELEVPVGTMAATGIVVANPAVKKTGDQIIQSSYTAAARQNGKKYMPMMTDVNKVSVIEKGQDSGVIMTGDANLSEANYKVSLQNLVNRVLITDQKGAVISTVEDLESQAKYGIVQKILEQEEKKDATQEAKNMLKNSEATAAVSGFPDDPRALAGYAVIVEEEATGLKGRFFVTADTHKYANGEATMDLTLEFHNLMDEQEIDQKDDAKK